MSFFFSSPFDSPFYTAPRAQPRHYQQPSYVYVPRGYYQADDDSSDDDEGAYYQPQYRQATPQQRYNYQQLQQLRQQQLKEEYQRQQLQQQRQEQLRLQRMRQLEQQRAEELRRRQEYERRQQELLQQQHEKRIREQEQLQLRRKVLFLRYTHAAKVIQRAFRTHLANKRNHDAKVIQAAFKRSQEREALKRIMEKLATVRALGDQLAKLREQHEATVLSKPVYSGPNATLPNKDYLMYEDALLKLMIKLDGVSSAGSELVRDARKALVAQAQKQLQVIDQHKNNSKAAVPEEISPKDEGSSEAPVTPEVHETSVASESLETSDAESEPVLVDLEDDHTATDNSEHQEEAPADEEEASAEPSMEVDHHDSQDLPEDPNEEFIEPRIEEAEENDEENEEAESEEFEETDTEELRIEEEEDVETEEPETNEESELVSTDSNWVILPEQMA